MDALKHTLPSYEALEVAPQPHECRLPFCPVDANAAAVGDGAADEAAKADAVAKVAADEAAVDADRAPEALRRGRRGRRAVLEQWAAEKRQREATLLLTAEEKAAIREAWGISAAPARSQGAGAALTDTKK